MPGGSCAAGPAPQCVCAYTHTHTHRAARGQMWEQTVPGSQGGKPNEFSLPTPPLCVLPTVLAKLFGNWLGLQPRPNQRKMSHNGKNKTAAQAFSGLRRPSRARPGGAATGSLGRRAHGPSPGAPRSWVASGFKGFPGDFSSHSHLGPVRGPKVSDKVTVRASFSSELGCRRQL